MESKKNQTKEQVLIPRSKAIIALVTAGIVLGSAGFAVGLGVGYRSNVNSRLSKEMQNFLKYYETFKDNYYLEENERTLIDGLFYGLTSSVNDDFTFYVSSENNQSQGLGTTSVGVGFERSVYYGNCLITHVMRTSPASQAQFIDAEGNKIEGDIGLKDGDIITKVKEANVVSDYYVLKEHHFLLILFY